MSRSLESLGQGAQNSKQMPLAYFDVLQGLDLFMDMRVEAGGAAMAEQAAGAGRTACHCRGLRHPY